MAKSPEQMIEMMVEGAQPHCDEPLRSAMVCSHAGSMSMALTSPFASAIRVGRRPKLPNPVLLAVGPSTVYAFKYKPRGFKVKLKSGSEVARWPRDAVDVEVEKAGAVTRFALVTPDDAFPLEVTTAFGAAGAFEIFVDSIRAPS